MAKRKNYKAARELLEDVLLNDMDNTKEIEIKKDLLKYYKEKYSDDIIKNRINLSMYLKGDSNIDWNKKEDFVKIYYDEIKYVEDTIGLTTSEKSFLTSLFEFLMFETNLLIDENGDPLTSSELAKRLGLRPQNLSRSITKLIKKKLIIKLKRSGDRNSYYILNPYIAFKGVRINKGLIILFDSCGYVHRGTVSDTTDVSNCNER